ncbi:MAG TPA: SDR family NAD(P)-dependent oxidoreductase [Acidimicrobiia bacterium]|nr:SDR family NAD(P)-dependent oxidoreductase [Acidimicrobiia bacterium]
MSERGASRVSRRGRLEGKVAIVTGGASGFGRATALRFAAEGARVVIGDLDEAGGRETVDRIAASAAGDGEPVARFVPGDVTDPAVAARLVETAVDRFGTLTTLVNNAGIAQGTPRDTWDVDPEVWDRLLRVNLRSVYACSRAAIPALVEAGGGSIVSVASIAASVCIGGTAYAASKGAILSYTRHLARELAARGVRANCVSPGFMRTPMSTGERDGLDEAAQEARLAEFAQGVPMRRVGSVDDIANAILFFASDESGYVTGQELVVDGGYLVR